MDYRSSESSSTETLVAVEETPQVIDVEKLGRKRPDVFSSTWMEVAFVASILTSLAMAVRNSPTNISTSLTPGPRTSLSVASKLSSPP